MTLASPAPRVRPPAVAGLFYPDRRDALDRALDDALVEARPVSPPARRPPKALIVPHAGYVYSGPVAASGYRRLEGVRGRIRRVVLLGPVHRVPVRGLALPGVDAFDTPLGRVPLDADAIAALADLPQVIVSAAAHAREHSLEVQLPFLQRWLGSFALVPLAVGDASAGEVAEVLERLWGDDATLVVISSDLSHYHPYDEARAIDAATVQAILAGDARLGHDQACGATPVAGLLEVARRRGLVADLCDLRNSGDTAGDRTRVVGYASVAFHPADAGAATRDDDTDAEHAAKGAALLGLARGAIAQALGATAAADLPRDDWLHAPGATFVTLRAGEALRGCIGTLEAHRPLVHDVTANALAAAFRDPRFPPLARHELDDLTVEVSILDPAQPVAFTDRAHLVAQLAPGEDGLVLALGSRRATFLPQVWDALPAPDDFLDALARKAGIPAARLGECTVHRYRVRKWSEEEFPG
jgi:AmmeMemoRadiSam system protein B/AmmeMemoRadiSam system protein A